ncbi:hypothetical protein NDU88_004480 [Pleurodeles waltl]|uniref:Uncharacterized protein n=1 Tax=Pleurodeles waltl TaxID=8319 RepID=A0AAV7MA17_PLEWA|nr:hypothetical protein NDU88_004480 [Pleurodeles waltl]
MPSHLHVRSDQVDPVSNYEAVDKAKTSIKKVVTPHVSAYADRGWGVRLGINLRTPPEGLTSGGDSGRTHPNLVPFILQDDIPDIVAPEVSAGPATPSIPFERQSVYAYVLCYLRDGYLETGLRSFHTAEGRRKKEEGRTTAQALQGHVDC